MKIVYTLKYILGLLLCFFALSAFIAEAHQIKTDNGVTVLLHVDPSDEPYSGTTTRMYFVFSGEQHINASDCECKVLIAPYSKLSTIEAEGDVIDLSKQSERVLGSNSISYLFPKHDVYAVVFEGSPKEGIDFPSFRIIYTVRVAQGEEIDDGGVEISMDYFKVHMYVMGGVLLALIFLIFLLLKRRASM